MSVNKWILRFGGFSSVPPTVSPCVYSHEMTLWTMYYRDNFSCVMEISPVICLVPV